MTDSEEKELLSTAKIIAVVGLSTNPAKDSYRVAEYLLQQGYRIIPVNPAAETILGQECKPSLAAISEPVDIVDVFRRPEDALKVAQECAETGLKTVWYQLGTISPDDAAKAREMGLELVTDVCIMREHRRLFA